MEHMEHMEHMQVSSRHAPSALGPSETIDGAGVQLSNLVLDLRQELHRRRAAADDRDHRSRAGACSGGPFRKMAGGALKVVRAPGVESHSGWTFDPRCTCRGLRTIAETSLTANPPMARSTAVVAGRPEGRGVVEHAVTVESSAKQLRKVLAPLALRSSSAAAPART